MGVTDQREDRSYPSSSWTGIPEASASPPPAPPPVTPAGKREALMIAIVFLLFLADVLLWVVWWLLLALHSPSSPSVSTGHTELLRSGRGLLSLRIYVTPTEAQITSGLALLTLFLPAGYFVWRKVRGRLRRRGS